MTTNTIQFTNGRLKITGDILTYEVFAKPFRIGQRLPRKKKESHSETTDQNIVPADKPKAQTRLRNLYAAKRRLTDWINTNVKTIIGKNGLPIPPIFMTLTFGDNITDLNEAHKYFKQFIAKVNYQVFHTKKAYIKYAATFEIQKKRLKKYGYAVWHYHVIFFNWEMIDTKTGVTAKRPFWQNLDKDLLQNIWDNGHLDIRDITEVTDVGWYMTKYMVKDANDPKLNGRISYLVSKNLNKPGTIYNTDFADMLLKDLPDDSLQHFRKDIPVNFLGSNDRMIFNLAKYPELRERNELLIKEYFGEV